MRLGYRLYLKNFDYTYEGPYPFSEVDWDNLPNYSSHYLGYVIIKNLGEGDEIVARKDFEQKKSINKEKTKIKKENKLSLKR